MFNTICYDLYAARVKEEGRGFYCIQFGGVALSQSDPRKLKREKVQNPTSAKIATLENFPLYGNYYTAQILNWGKEFGSKT